MTISLSMDNKRNWQIVIILLPLLKKASGWGNLKFLVSIHVACWWSPLCSPLGPHIALQNRGFFWLAAFCSACVFLPRVSPLPPPAALPVGAWGTLTAFSPAGTLLLLSFTLFHGNCKCKSKTCLLPDEALWISNVFFYQLERNFFVSGRVLWGHSCAICNIQLGQVAMPRGFILLLAPAHTLSAWLFIDFLPSSIRRYFLQKCSLRYKEVTLFQSTQFGNTSPWTQLYK